MQPCEQPVQIEAVLSSSHARALCRKSFESSEPTGQRSTTFPAQGWSRRDSGWIPMNARSPRSDTLSTGSLATSSMKRTQRVHRMQRFGTYKTPGPKSSTGLKHFEYSV